MTAMNYTISCPPIVMQSQYSQDLSYYDHIFKMVSCTIMLLLIIPVTSLNLLVILTIIKTPSLQTPSFLLMCSLALTDFASGLVAFPINASWRIVEFLDHNANVCSTFDVGFAMAFTLLSSSELTITALSIDRYLAIRLSQLYRQQVTNRRVVLIVMVSWCVAVGWGVSSVFMTPKVLHTTVVVVGVITFGTIFLCFALAVKTLFEQESRTGGLSDRPANVLANKSTGTLEEEEVSRDAATSPRLQQVKRLQINLKVSPSEENKVTTERQEKIRTSLQSEMTQGKMRTLEVAEPKPGLEKSCVQNTHCEGILDVKDDIFTAICVSTSSNDNSRLSAHVPRKGSSRLNSISVCNSETSSVLGISLNQESKTKGPVNNVMEKMNSRPKRFFRLPKIRSGVGVRLVKYRYTVMTLLWVIVMFIVCYAPYFFLSFVVAFTGMANEEAVAWSIAIAAMCTNSLINPLIYLWRLRILRKACWSILKRACC